MATGSAEAPFADRVVPRAAAPRGAWEVISVRWWRWLVAPVISLFVVAAADASGHAANPGQLPYGLEVLGWNWTCNSGGGNCGLDIMYSDGGSVVASMPYEPSHLTDPTWTRLDATAPLLAYYAYNPQAASGLFPTDDGLTFSADALAAMTVQNFNPAQIGGVDVPPQSSLTPDQIQWLQTVGWGAQLQTWEATHSASSGSSSTSPSSGTSSSTSSSTASGSAGTASGSTASAPPDLYAQQHARADDAHDLLRDQLLIVRDGVYVGNDPPRRVLAGHRARARQGGASGAGSPPAARDAAARHASSQAGDGRRSGPPGGAPRPAVVRVSLAVGRWRRGAHGAVGRRWPLAPAAVRVTVPRSVLTCRPCRL